MGGKTWLTSVKKRYNIKNYEKKRPLEIERVRKAQPEITLDYLRLILHTQADESNDETSLF